MLQVFEGVTFALTSMWGMMSDNWESCSEHNWRRTVMSPQRCSTWMVSLSEAVWAGMRVCDDSKWITALAMSSISTKNASSASSRVLWWLHARWNSSMTALREALAPAAHCKRWEIRNCWLWIFSVTLLIWEASCSERTWYRGNQEGSNITF